MVKSPGTLWQISIRPLPGRSAPEHRAVVHALDLLNPLLRHQFDAAVPPITTERGYLLRGEIDANAAEAIARELLIDPLLEEATIGPLESGRISSSTMTILKRPGVMDPVALSAREAARDLGFDVDQVWTFRRHGFPAGTRPEVMATIASQVLALEAIERVVTGEVDASLLGPLPASDFVKITVPLKGMDDLALEKLSRDGQLYLNLAEMRAIRDHFARLGRNPTDIEIETLAQTWSEHCSHKTLRGPYEMNGNRHASGLLKDTIMHATRSLDRDWCVSVFEDNAGVIRFDEDWNLCFKVETHNHPSAIEPYGGANTGIGGVIRDPMGTGLGAKPICNTDVFCVAPPETPHESLPPGVLHPERILRGVVAGVRDYGNRMGIPTVNGAVCFHPRFLANPLVYCGTVGLLPADKSFGRAEPNDLIVAIGGRTGRDGIHGATFSSGELTQESETVSAGAVQIGNAITEKKVLDVLLQARDQGLYHAITDCGAGGFSSAIGEMGARLGAFVRLENAPLKYEGLTYTEIWISEAQERMILAVPPENWPALKALARAEDVEAVVLGHFEPTGKLLLSYRDTVVGELDMRFLHDGRPAVVHTGVASERTIVPHRLPDDQDTRLGPILRRVLGSLNVASKEWIIRQYDHEVQGRSVIKPLVGVAADGPSDAAVLTPILGKTRGIAIGCGLNPAFGDLDPYRMAASAIDEAVRNVVAVGGDPEQTAILDNFCWGNTERPEVFGSLCQAAMACRDVAIAFGTPFISGKDSLNNEYAHDSWRMAIPPTLLISALAIVPDVRQSVSMDFKEPGNLLYVIGVTRPELGGSQLSQVLGGSGGEVPLVDTELAPRTFKAVHAAMLRGLIRSCHDVSEGGLAVALAEMAFSGALGARVDIDSISMEEPMDPLAILFSESNSRFVVEVEPSSRGEFEAHFSAVPIAAIGAVTKEPVLRFTSGGSELLAEPIAELKACWQSPLAW